MDGAPCIAMKHPLSLIVLLVSCTVFVFATSIPSIHISAKSPYDFGYQIGFNLRERFQDYAQKAPDLHKHLIPHYNTTEGREIFDEFVAANCKQYPDTCSELDGWADGAGVPRHYLYLVMLRSEYSNVFPDMLDNAPLDKECSDVLSRTPEGRLYLGHNEDWDHFTGNYTFLLRARLQYPHRPLCEYTAFGYPFVLPGNAYSWNHFGLFVSTNAVSPKQIVRRGIGRYFINHDLICATSVSDAIKRATLNQSEHHEKSDAPRASGFSLNLASVKENRLFNIEINQFNYSIREICSDHPHEFHTNHFLRALVPQRVSNSSSHRYVRGSKMAAPHSAKTVADVLGDTHDTAYPIYRNQAPPDYGCTLSTAVLDVDKELVRVYAQQNPKDAFEEPLGIFPIRPPPIETGTPYIVGMAVGLPLSVLVTALITSCFWWQCSKRRRAGYTDLERP
eukprot:gnl/Trimastix_PCT/2864.p1 GENE.gnl/Trimastix_PCT/2864~~gnl/Trimastix_PCT/2864.p1  ORF type:complete len:449 (+),score=122.87 gnl/Trimastix_PCT/2864:15-1361(+)